MTVETKHCSKTNVYRIMKKLYTKQYWMQHINYILKKHTAYYEFLFDSVILGGTESYVGHGDMTSHP